MWHLQVESWLLLACKAERATNLLESPQQGDVMQITNGVGSALAALNLLVREDLDPLLLADRKALTLADSDVLERNLSSIQSLLWKRSVRELHKHVWLL